MKKIFWFLVFIIIGVFSYSNDMELISEGGNLMPFEISDMSIKKEKLSLKMLENYDTEVTVNFVFDSPTSKRRTLGFITPKDEWVIDPPSGEEYNPKDIKGFKTTVNGKDVKINITRANKFMNKGLFTSDVEKEYKDNYSKSYAYYFEADFKKGENIVEHRYIYRGISSTFSKRDYSYVLTTISSWKNKKVDDFEMILYMKPEILSLPYTFWKNEQPIKWEIVGKGKIVFIDKSKINGYPSKVFARVENGYVRYKTKDFSPDKDFYLSVPMRGAFEFIPENLRINGYLFRDKLTNMGMGLTHPIDKKWFEKLSDYELEIMRNYPYAISGYEFSRDDLKKYFEQFFWYNPVGKVEVDEDLYVTNYKDIINIVNEILEKRGNVK